MGVTYGRISKIKKKNKDIHKKQTLTFKNGLHHRNISLLKSFILHIDS